MLNNQTPCAMHTICSTSDAPNVVVRSATGFYAAFTRDGECLYAGDRVNAMAVAYEPSESATIMFDWQDDNRPHYKEFSGLKLASLGVVQHDEC